MCVRTRLPTETIKWSGGFLLLPGKIAPEAGGNAVDYVQSQCSELDVNYSFCALFCSTHLSCRLIQFIPTMVRF